MSELPKPGEVWGVPDKPETWRLISRISVTSGTIYFEQFGLATPLWRPLNGWPRDAVRIFPKDTP